MTFQANTAELTFVDARSFAERDLNLGVTMIQDTCVRSPYSAIGSVANLVHTPVVRSPYSAGRMTLRSSKSIVSIG